MGNNIRGSPEVTAIIKVTATIRVSHFGDWYVEQKPLFFSNFRRPARAGGLAAVECGLERWPASRARRAAKT